MAGFKEYDQYDATGLAGLVKGGQVTPLELLDEAIARCGKVNPAINAVIRPMFDLARANATHPVDGPFSGVPFLLKDLIASYAGVEMNSGSRFFKGFVPDQDSEFVRRIKAAGLNIFGKTNTPEFGLTPSTEPELFGATRNPWDPLRSPGGSSGGSAAAVASGVVPMASAGDGGGSIRIPASCCGLFGLKPTRGRVPSGPEHPDGWFGFIAEGVVSRSVRDSAHFLDAVQGSYPGQVMQVGAPAGLYADAAQRAPGRLRIAFSTDPALGETLHPDCKAAVLDAVALLTELGHDCVEVRLPIDREAFIYHYTVLICAELAATRREGEITTGRKAKPSDFEARTWALIRLGDSFTAGDVARSVWWMTQFSRQWMTTFAPFDALLTSTLGEPPCKVGQLRPTSSESIELLAMGHLPIGFIAKRPEFVLKAARRVFNYCSQTMPANVTGQPSMSVPLFWNSGNLPIGAMFTGRHGQEDVLLSLAGQLEQARPWFNKRPATYSA